MYTEHAYCFDDDCAFIAAEIEHVLLFQKIKAKTQQKHSIATQHVVIKSWQKHINFI